jgi:hypothetical protein
VRCYLGGHQDVRAIPHREVCETPWETEHLALTEGEVDRVCAYCDSDWL